MRNVTIKILFSLLFFIIFFTLVGLSDARAQARCTGKFLGNRTVGTFYNENSGNTNWETWIRYSKWTSDGYKKLPAVTRWVPAGGNATYTITNYQPNSNDTVKWYTACVDPVSDVNITGISTSVSCRYAGEDYYRDYKYKIDTTCYANRTNQTKYRGCGAANRSYGNVGINDVCPSNQSNDCIKGGYVEPCNAGQRSCGSGGNACDRYEKDCKYSNSQGSWCVNKLIANNSTACAGVGNCGYGCNSSTNNCSLRPGGNYGDKKQACENDCVPKKYGCDRSTGRCVQRAGGTDLNTCNRNCQKDECSNNADCGGKDVCGPNNTANECVLYNTSCQDGKCVKNTNSIKDSYNHACSPNSCPPDPSNLLVARVCQDNGVRTTFTWDPVPKTTSYTLSYRKGRNNWVRVKVGTSENPRLVRTLDFSANYDWYVTARVDTGDWRGDKESVRKAFQTKSRNNCIDTFNISGTVWENTARGRVRYKSTNQQKKPKIQVVDEERFAFGNNNGDYTISGNPDGEYEVRLIPDSLRNNYSVISQNPRKGVEVNGANVNNIDFVVSRSGRSTYSIEGRLFKDNPPRGSHGPEDQYIASSGNEKVTISGGETQTNFDAAGFIFDELSEGTYNVTFGGVRSEYYVSFRPGGYSVTIGDSCSAPNPAQCVDGNVTDVLFGITPRATKWYQGVGGDMRGRLTNIIPDNYYFSKKNDPLLSPGLVYNFTLTNFGSQNSKASQPEGWYVDSNFAGRSIKTSYNYVMGAITKGGGQLINLFGRGQQCGGGVSPNCFLDKPPEGYFYTNNRDVVIKKATFRANSKYVFLIDGNLTIDINDPNNNNKAPWTVPPGTSVLFIARGNIIVDPNVTHFEGIFSADNDFRVNSKNPTADEELVIEGSVIANAAKGAGLFINNRDLKNDNSSTPAVRIIYRPDLVLNAPILIRSTNYKFQEVAPKGN